MCYVSFFYFVNRILSPPDSLSASGGKRGQVPWLQTAQVSTRSGIFWRAVGLTWTATLEVWVLVFYNFRRQHWPSYLRPFTEAILKIHHHKEGFVCGFWQKLKMTFRIILLILRVDWDCACAFLYPVAIRLQDSTARSQGPCQSAFRSIRFLSVRGPVFFWLHLHSLATVTGRFGLPVSHTQRWQTAAVKLLL